MAFQIGAWLPVASRPTKATGGIGVANNSEGSVDYIISQFVKSIDSLYGINLGEPPIHDTKITFASAFSRLYIHTITM